MDNRTLALGMTGVPMNEIADVLESGAQSELVNSAQLPSDMQGDRAKFEAMGIVFGEPVDDLFISATLPKGWSKRRTGHNMWSDLVDDQGRKRGAIFYKGAFWDRAAHMGACRRFSLTTEYDDENERTRKVAMDCETVVCFGPWLSDADKRATYDDTTRTREENKAIRDNGHAECLAYLDNDWPDWQSDLAYWSEE